MNNGQFKPGQGGRPKGATNKATAELRTWITEFIEGQREKILEDWKALEPKERIVMFEKLLKYTLPTLQAVSSAVEFDRLTDNQLDEIINRLLQNEANTNEQVGED